MSEHVSVVQLFAERYNLKKDTMFPLLKMIAPPEATEDDILGFLLIAYRFDLDPWAKEIYLIKGKGGRVQPYISVDGYARIVNRQPEYDNCEFSYQQNQAGEVTACTCTMWRKDRSRPIVVTEFYDECVQFDREGKATPAWGKTPSRMLRTRAFTQAARLCFGVSAALAEEEIEFQTGGQIIDERKMISGNATRTLEHGQGDQAVPMAKEKAKEKEPAKEQRTQQRRAPSPSQQKRDPDDDQQRREQGEPKQQSASISADHERFLHDLDDALADGTTEDEVKDIYQNLAPEQTLGRSVPANDRAADLLLKHIKRVEERG